MKKDEARILAETVLTGSNQFQHSVYLAKQAMTEEQSAKYKELVGIFLVDVLCDILNPIFKEHPDLKPENWDEPYVPKSKK